MDLHNICSHGQCLFSWGRDAKSKATSAGCFLLRNSWRSWEWYRKKAQNDFYKFWSFMNLKLSTHWYCLYYIYMQLCINSCINDPDFIHGVYFLGKVLETYFISSLITRNPDLWITSFPVPWHHFSIGTGKISVVGCSDSHRKVDFPALAKPRRRTWIRHGPMGTAQPQLYGVLEPL